MHVFNNKNVIFFMLIITIIFLNANSNKYFKGGNNNFTILKKINLNNNFTILKKVNLNNKLLISTTIFVTDISLIDDNKYIKGLHQLHNWCLKYNYVLRIYFDESVENYLKKNFLNKKNIELYKYHFPKFYIKHKKVHEETFGSLIRFLPLFNLKDHYHDNVFVSDCDFDLFLKTTSNNIIDFVNKNKHLYNNILISKSKYFYGLIKRLQNRNNNNVFPLQAGCLYNYNNKFDINILENYINNLKIEDAIYGCDEFFLNKNLFNTCNNKTINIFIYNRQFKDYYETTSRFDLVYNSNKKKIYNKCSSIFLNYIKKYSYDIDIENIKENHIFLNKLQNIYKLNSEEILYLEGIYYNYFYKKYGYNFVINKIFFINNQVYNSLYMTCNKLNNINYYIPSIYNRDNNVKLKHINMLKQPLIVYNYINHNYNFKDICMICKNLKITVRYGDYDNINNVLQKKRKFYKTTILDYYNNINNFSKNNPDYAGNNIIDKKYLQKLKINKLKELYNTFDVCKLWIGLNKSITPLHKDGQKNFSIQLYGKKKWIIYSINDIPNLCYKNNTRLDWSKYIIDNYNSCPNANKTIKFECIVEKNDLLYLPVFWSHQVENLNKSIMINFWYKNLN